MAQDNQKSQSIVWRQPDGAPVTCHDKIVVLNENLSDLRQECQDVMEDALLMGCDENQIREVLEEIIRSAKNPFKKR